MSRNGSGTYTAPSGAWNPAINGNSATAADWNALLADLAAAMTQSVSADGQTTITGNLNMGNNKLSSLAAGNASGQSLAWQQLFSQGTESDLASATTTDIGAQNTNFLRITGTTTITSFGANYNGPRFLRFSDALTLTHNATTLVLPGGGNISTSAGDTCIFIPKATSGTPDGWVCVSYPPAWYASSNFILSVAVPVRQTVLSGAVDANGFSSFGGSTGSTTVTAASTLIATAANGASNRTGTILNPSWTGLSSNGTMYLGLTVNAYGTCTPFVTTLAPTYQWGGTFSTANNQRTFNIQQMQMQVGNGTTAAQAFDVFVGEVTVAGGVVTAIVWYALMGRYKSGYTNTLPGAASSVSRNHNIGTTFIRTRFQVKCLTAQASYVVGEVEPAPWRQSGVSNSSVIVPTVQSHLAMHISTGNTLPVGGFDPTNGGAFAMTPSFWAYEFTAERDW
jgi:hypothetical protein